MAVGNVSTASGTAPLAETLTGRRWRASTLPAPGGGSFPAPLPWSVSCVDSGCVALGAFLTGGNAGGLVAETLEAGRWTADALPLPAGGTRGFPFTYEPQGGVSCAAAASCVAVSTYEASEGGQTGLGETLSRGVWTPVSLPSPADGSSPFPQGVSCTASQSCVAVGSYPPNGGGESPLSETLSGTTWTAGELPVPAATPAASLTALWCASASSCVAVGNAYDVNHAQEPFGETLSGTGWTAAPLPLPVHTVSSGDASPVIQGLSCSSGSSCVAVGYDPGPSLTERPLAEMMSGGIWKAERLPLPQGMSRQSASLSAVACVSATSCVAVGVLRSENDALIESLTGSTWVATALPPPGHEPRVSLSSVSCPSATSCVAVGAYWGANPGFSRPLAATLSARGWNTTKLAVPPGARSDIAFTAPMLQSVSCVTAGSCAAVGFYPTSFDAAAPLVETLSGSSWRATTPPVTTGGNWTLLWGVSCRSDTSCIAVGEDDGAPLTEGWSGQTWTPAAVPLAAGDTGASLQAVSCTAVASCTAVGGGIGVTGIHPFVASDSN